VFQGLARDPGLPPFWRTVAHCGLGVTEYWCGAVTEAGAALGDAAGLAQADGNRLAELYARGYLALIGAEHGDLRDAEALARRAVGLSEEPSVAEHFVAMVAHLASGRLRERQGRLEEAEGDCERALDLARRGAASVEVAAAVLALARVRRARGDLDGARVLRDEADALLASCPDPGLVAGSRLPAAPKRPVHAGERLSEREHAVLRLLPGGLSQREIAAALYVSLNTVKTHVRGIYLKLDASSRAEAVAHARERGLL
jgi:LuxR family transcriptional regulator, maltose regulon positive regulatory protein